MPVRNRYKTDVPLEKRIYFKLQYEFSQWSLLAFLHYLSQKPASSEYGGGG